MLLTRVQKARDCLEVDEIFEKAEIRLISMLQYDPEVSQKLNKTRVKDFAIENQSVIDLRTLSEIANAFIATNSGGSIFTCLNLIVEQGVTLDAIREDPGSYLMLANSLNSAGFMPS